MLLVTENQLLYKDLPESAGLHGTELADIVLYTNCVQEHSGINGPVWKSVSGCLFNLDFLTGVGITDDNRWSWQTLFLLGKVVQCLENVLVELGQWSWALLLESLIALGCTGKCGSTSDSADRFCSILEGLCWRYWLLQVSTLWAEWWVVAYKKIGIFSPSLGHAGT